MRNKNHNYWIPQRGFLTVINIEIDFLNQYIDPGF